MLRIERFFNTYNSLIVTILMFILCILDIFVLVVDFNIWSLIGAVCCGISCVLNLIVFVGNSRRLRRKKACECEK